MFGRDKIHCIALSLFLCFLAWPGWAYDVLDDLEVAFEAHITNDFDTAINLYTKIIKAKKLPRKNLSILYLLRGEAYAEKGALNPAIENFTDAISLRPDYAHAYYFRGNCYEEKGEYEKAWDDLQLAISIKPDKELYRESQTLLASLVGKDEKELVSFTPARPVRKVSKLLPKPRREWKSAFLQFLRSPWSFLKSVGQK
ncbi:MAG: tetratricopeptide repeat protein [Deltaproteobacteria bacterium]|nr:tetratricopeptide repeat protein [Deltaproteobacteria bacterium]